MEIRFQPFIKNLNVLIFVFLAGCYYADKDVNAKGRLSNTTDGELSMATETFDQLYSSMMEQTGSSYIKSRDTILMSSELRKEAIQKAKEKAMIGADWRTQRTVEILSGWVNNQEQFNLCKEYAEGNLPGRPPLPGFTVHHRAKAIAALGPSITPRIIEILWKSKEYKDLSESSALLVAAKLLKDKRLVEPLVELIKGEEPEDIQAISMAVLAAINDNNAFEFIHQYVKQTKGEGPVRLQAIIALGAFENRKSTDVLESILANSDLALAEHLSAAEGMLSQPQVFSRETVLQRLENAWDEGLVLNLVSIMGHIGIRDDIPALKQKAHLSEMVGDYVEEAIEEIESR